MSDTQKISQTVERPAATGDGGLMLLVALALLGLVRHDHGPRMRGIGLEPGENADRVARRCQREFRRHDDHVHIPEQMREIDHHVARKIDHRHLESLTELFLQLDEGGAVGHQRRADRRFGREDRQVVVGADHRALDEQSVDAARIVDRVGQAATRFEIERQGAGAEMHVEIEQRGRHLVIDAEQPGERSRDGGCPYAAARADDRGGDMALGRRAVGLRRSEDHLRMRQRIAQLRGVQRLEQIVVNAARQQIAIEPHVVHLPDGDDHRAGFAHFGQGVDVVQRIAAFRQVDEEDRRTGAD